MNENNLLEENGMDLVSALTETIRLHKEQLHKVACDIAERLLSGATIFWCGNGGSAAESQHMAAELSGTFKFNRPPLASISLTSNSSAITSIANDFEFDYVFERQIVGFSKPGDILIGYSTSGTSKNVLRAMQAARKKNVLTVAFVGISEGSISTAADVAFHAQSKDTPRIQEIHTLLGHTLCEIIEKATFDEPRD